MLGDLGLGKAMDMSSRLTMVGGTPSYVAPEQALGEGLDSRADQFSLAALSYHLLTGRQPYAHASLAAAENPAPPAPMEIDDPAVEAVVLRGLAKDREDRFPDVAAFTAALVEAVGEPVDETPAAWIPADPDLTRAAASTEATGRGERPAAARLAGPAPPPVAVGGGRRPGPGHGHRRRLGARAHRRTAERTLEDVDRAPSSSPCPSRGPRRSTPSSGRRSRDGPSSRRSRPAPARAGTPTTTPARASSSASCPATGCPPACRGHAECAVQRGPYFDENRDGDDIMTVFFSGCPGVDLTVERVDPGQPEPAALGPDPQPTTGATANRVLDSVQASGV